MDDFSYLNEEVCKLRKLIKSLEKDVALLKKIPKDFTAKDLHKLVEMLSMTLERLKDSDKQVLEIKSMFEGLEKSIRAYSK